MEPRTLQCVSCSEPGETKWILLGCDDDVHILVYFNYHKPSTPLASIGLSWLPPVVGTKR